MRTEGWRGRLAQYISDLRGEPFAYGSQDCWLFVAGAVEAMTGIDHAKAHRSKYKTAKGALGIVKRAGADSIADFAGLYLEEYEAPIFAQIGDVVAIPTDNAFGYSLGILNGEQVLVVTETGIGVRDRSDVARAFKV